MIGNFDGFLENINISSKVDILIGNHEIPLKVVISLISLNLMKVTESTEFNGISSIFHCVYKHFALLGKRIFSLGNHQAGKKVIVM